MTAAAPVTALILLSAANVLAIREGFNFICDAEQEILSATHRTLNLTDFMFVGCENIKTLDLSYNKIVSLPSRGFAQFPNLTDLDLSSNPVTTVAPDAFDGIQLKNLRLNNMRHPFKETGFPITKETFCSAKGLRNLKKLWLTAALPLATATLPEDVFNCLPELDVLDLSYNYLTSLSLGIFRSLGNVTRLKLHNNAISRLPHGAFKGSKIRQLNLAGNSLQSLRAGVFAGLGTKLYFLSVYKNPLTIIEPGVFDGLLCLGSWKYSYSPFEPHPTLDPDLKDQPALETGPVACIRRATNASEGRRSREERRRKGSRRGTNSTAFACKVDELSGSVECPVTCATSFTGTRLYGGDRGYCVCPPGEYYKPPSACFFCPTGKYSSQPGSTACEDCKSGYTRETGATSQDSCKMDPADVGKIIYAVCAGAVTLLVIVFAVYAERLHRRLRKLLEAQVEQLELENQDQKSQISYLINWCIQEDQLECREKIAAGSEGEVWLGNLKGRDKPVAIKKAWSPDSQSESEGVWHEAEVVFIMAMQHPRSDGGAARPQWSAPAIYCAGVHEWGLPRQAPMGHSPRLPDMGAASRLGHRHSGGNGIHPREGLHPQGSQVHERALRC